MAWGPPVSTSQGLGPLNLAPGANVNTISQVRKEARVAQPLSRDRPVPCPQHTKLGSGLLCPPWSLGCSSPTWVLAASWSSPARPQQVVRHCRGLTLPRSTVRSALGQPLPLQGRPGLSSASTEHPPPLRPSKDSPHPATAPGRGLFLPLCLARCRPEVSPSWAPGSSSCVPTDDGQALAGWEATICPSTPTCPDPDTPPSAFPLPPSARGSLPFCRPPSVGCCPSPSFSFSDPIAVSLGLSESLPLPHLCHLLPRPCIMSPPFRHRSPRFLPSLTCVDSILAPTDQGLTGRPRRRGGRRRLGQAWKGPGAERERRVTRASAPRGRGGP